MASSILEDVHVEGTQEPLSKVASIKEKTLNKSINESNNICQYIWPARRELTCFLLAIVLFIIATIIGTKAAYCGMVVLYMGILWVTESVPLAVTALIPIVAYPFFGILSADIVSKEYLPDTNYIFLGSLIVAIAVEKTNLHERAALRIMLITGTSPRWLMFGFQAATCLTSMWLTNTATVAMILPILMKIIVELEKCEQEKKEGKLQNSNLLGANANEEEFVLSVDKIDPKQLRIYKGLLLAVAYTAGIGGTGTLVGTAPNLIMADIINTMYLNDPPISFTNWLLYAVPSMIILTIFCWVWLQFFFVGFGPTDKEKELAVYKVLERKYHSLGSIRFSEGVVATCFMVQVLVWFSRNPGFVAGWGSLFPRGFVKDGTSSVMIALLLFILPSENPFRVGRTSGQYPPILTWKDMTKFSWGTILLLGGSFAMAKGVTTSGLSYFFGEKLKIFENMPQWLFISFASLMATILTQFSSNIATTTIFIPILLSVSLANHQNPMKYILPVTLSSSYAFMFPAGTPPNAIVFGCGLLKVIDMVYAGSVMSAFSFMMIVFMTYIGFDSYMFPMEKLPPSWNNSVIA